MESEFKIGSDFAKFLDNNDVLGDIKKRFYDKPNYIYMCGNSLGLASKDSEEATLKILEEWKKEGVNIWNVDNNKYYMYSMHLAKLMAPIVGADNDEIAIVSSTTVNIHQLISTFYKPTKDRYKILIDDINFPTDRYAIESQIRLKGYTTEEAVKVVKNTGKYLEEDDIIAAMTEDVAIVFLSAVYYRSAQVLDMKKITEAANKRCIQIGWDLCHAAGVLEINLKALHVDFAVWCTYKYLNGGPGAPAALYINRKHFNLYPGLAGWFGNRSETQFMLHQFFEPRRDAGGWQMGTPHLLSMGALEGSLKMISNIGIVEIRKKSLRITRYLIYLIDEKLTKFGFSVGNLREDSRRGGHVCLEHNEAYRLSLAMRARGVVPDFRDPNIIRLAPTALYTSYEEVYNMVLIIIDIVQNETYKKFSLKRNLVV